MLEIKNLHKAYGKFKAVNNLNIHISRGDIFGFVGPNGAGKTTTMKIISGLLAADSGQILLEGKNLLLKNSELKEKIGYMPDFFGVYDNLTAIEYLEFYSLAYGIDEKEAVNRCHELLEMVNLTDKADEYVDSLSRGMKQRLCLARTLVHNPDILILDEPASGMDPRARHEFKNILKDLKELGKTIIISSHVLTELSEMCNSVGIIEKGHCLIQGNINDILNKVDESNPLTLTVLGEVARAIEVLKENRYVKSLAVDQNSIMIVFVGRKQEEAALLKQLIERDVLVLSYKREQSDLESLFLQITNKGEEVL